MVRGGSGVLETIFHSELPVLVAYELWTVISVADCWNTISCEVGFGLLNDRGGYGIFQLVHLNPVREVAHS